MRAADYLAGAPLPAQCYADCAAGDPDALADWMQRLDFRPRAEDADWYLYWVHGFKRVRFRDPDERDEYDEELALLAFQYLTEGGGPMELHHVRIMPE